MANHGVAYLCICRLWAAICRSWQRNRCCWVSVMLLLVVLILVIALPAALVKRPGPAAPAFTFAPVLLAATSTSLDFNVAVSKAAVVHYVLLPRIAGSSVWTSFSSPDVRTAAAGWNQDSLEVGDGDVVAMWPTGTALVLEGCSHCGTFSASVAGLLQLAG